MSDQHDLDPVLSLLPRIYRSLGCLIGESFGLPQVSMSQYRAMSFLRRAPGSTLGDVARELDLTLGSASDLIDRLVSMGLVERQINPADRRQVQLSATEQAEAHIASLKSGRRRQFEAVRSELGDEEWAGFVKGLTVWSEVLDHTSRRKHDQTSTP
jgi:DNA-binding MarR family transcriptional regulator